MPLDRFHERFVGDAFAHGWGRGRDDSRGGDPQQRIAPDGGADDRWPADHDRAGAAGGSSSAADATSARASAAVAACAAASADTRALHVQDR